MPLSAVIVGAGIAGLSAGVALREFADVTILESATVLKEVGAAFLLAPNAREILQSWGMDPELVGATKLDGLQIWDSDGRAAKDVKFGDFNGVDVVAMHRADMHTALFKAATSTTGPGNPCYVHLGKRVKHVDPDRGIVTCTDGETYSADVIIGADGIRSAVRSFVLGDACKPPQPTGESAYRLLIPSSAVKAIHPDLAESVSGPWVHMMHIEEVRRKVIVYPCRQGAFMNMAFFVPDNELKEVTSATWTKKGDINALLQAYEGCPSMWSRLISCATDAGLWQLHDMDPLPTWVNKRALLIGDAAHPMLPHRAQGACQAIEDAEALATFLRGADHASAPEALRRVFRVRFRRASHAQAASRAAGLRNGANRNQRAIMGLWNYHGAERWEKEMPEQVLSEDDVRMMMQSA